MRTSIIFHIDVNSAFLSWQSVYRLSMGLSDLREIPAVIGGDPSQRGSIVSAKSIPAKKYGINTGEPVSMAMRKCPGLVVVPGDFALYRRCSADFIALCSKYSPHLEQFSIDECFLDVSESKEAVENPVSFARRLGDEIRDTLGFTVNIGISENKLLAKMASDFEKPDKVHTLWPEEIRDKMWPLPVGDLLFVGKSSTARLSQLGIRTIGDLANADRNMLISLFGEKSATSMLRSANGQDRSAVTTEHRDAKSYSIATTTEDDITTFEYADQLLTKLTDTVSYRMRRDGAKAYCIGINIRTTSFANQSHQRQLTDPTDISGEILRICKSLLREIWHGAPLRLIGITLSNVTREEFTQISLFDDEKKEKERKVDKVMDDLRSQFGKDIVKRGGSLL